jgi:CubicO group peptidase (beta-lactamase class C family)
MNMIIASPLNEKKEYLYSDMGYYFLKQIIESLTGSTLDKYTMDTFFKPLGLKTMGYRPKTRFGLDRIVPTEDDYYFRKQLVHGDVHDPGAAMMGGIGGHAGVFSNAHDLGVFMAMLLNDGKYGGQSYIEDSTLLEFTTCHYCDENRRAVGFDKPQMDYDKDGPTCQCISEESFGHTGFTGTIAWADPKEKIVYVFLSNRVNPDSENKKLVKMNVRTDIMQAIYDAIEEGHGKEGKGE